jgi:hypothetical protein
MRSHSGVSQSGPSVSVTRARYWIACLAVSAPAAIASTLARRTSS